MATRTHLFASGVVLSVAVISCNASPAAIGSRGEPEIYFWQDGYVYSYDGGPTWPLPEDQRLFAYTPDTWLDVTIKADMSTNTFSLSGTVTLDGRPLESGSINFRPAAGEKRNGSGGSITNGNFEISEEKGLEVGKYTVTVQAFRPTGRMVQDREFGEVSQMAAVQFREAQNLEAEISSEGAKHFEFKRTSVH